MSDDDRPPICRCGGIGLCKACNMDAALHWGRENNKAPTEKDPEQVDYWESFAEQVRASLNIIAEHQVAQVNILEKLFEMIKPQDKDADETEESYVLTRSKEPHYIDKIVVEQNPVHMEKVSYSFDDFINFLKKE